jgi:hypothetical protein
MRVTDCPYRTSSSNSVKQFDICTYRYDTALRGISDCPAQVQSDVGYWRYDRQAQNAVWHLRVSLKLVQGRPYFRHRRQYNNTYTYTVNTYDVLAAEYSLTQSVGCVVEGDICSLVSYLHKMYSIYQTYKLKRGASQTSTADLLLTLPYCSNTVPSFYYDEIALHTVMTLFNVTRPLERSQTKLHTDHNRPANYRTKFAHTHISVKDRCYIRTKNIIILLNYVFYCMNFCTVFSVVGRPGASLYLMQCLLIQHNCMSSTGTECHALYMYSHTQQTAANRTGISLDISTCHCAS